MSNDDYRVLADVASTTGSKQTSSDDEDLSNSYGVDFLLLKRFWRIFRIAVPKARSLSALQLALLLLLAVGAQFAYYYAGLIASKFYGVLTKKDEAGFRVQLWQSALIVMSAALAQCLVKFTSGWMYVTWRKQVTMRLHKDYFADITYYDINNSLEKKTVDNPDQRIAQDVDRFCNNFCNQLAAQVIVTPFVVAYYTYKCWKSVGYYGPALVYIYFGFGAVINRLIMTPIVRLVFGQEKLEGNFRFQHVQFRNHAETVAFYRSGKTEQTRIGHIFKKLLGVQWRLVKWNLALNWAIGLFAYLGSILSYLIVALGVFATQRFVSMSASEISVTLSENSFLVLYLISSFSTLISLSGTISDVAGFTHRVGQLLESINSASEKKKASGDKYTKSSSDTEAFRLVGVSYGPRGSQRILVNDLSLSIEEKRNVLITGKTGCGKSSLFRVINGLWDPFRGEVKRLISRSPENYLVLPQRPFFICGNLRAQVTYPLSMEDSSVDERIHRALSMACVDYLAERVGGLDHDHEPLTEDFVSVGEMQKLGFARLFFFMPKFAFLDEATSAMDEESEERLYRTCCDHEITLISISHRSSIRKFHHAELHLSGKGQWRLDEIDSHSND